MFSVSKPHIASQKAQVTYTKDLANANVFRERFESLTDEEWQALWPSTERETHMAGLAFPTVPEQALQLQIHGSASWEISRFLQRLQAEKRLLDEGAKIHWYSDVCIEYERGEFVWFTESGSP